VRHASTFACAAAAILALTGFSTACSRRGTTTDAVSRAASAVCTQWSWDDGLTGADNRRILAEIVGQNRSVPSEDVIARARKHCPDKFTSYDQYLASPPATTTAAATPEDPCAYLRTTYQMARKGFSSASTLRYAVKGTTASACPNLLAKAKALIPHLKDLPQSPTPSPSAPEPIATPMNGDVDEVLHLPRTTIVALGLMADRYGYGNGPGTALTYEQALNFAYGVSVVCDSVRSGEATYQDFIDDDMSTGAPASAARGMNNYLRDTFCPAYYKAGN
jgi:hypothetical protein